ncbi:hypothetical protein BVRB_5g122700 [Beta vulgaris subsp. vulgaris]|nr:hypothetical protein BVRB_5g122700 [Beta vulgaris subsp. vulgaris]
MKRCEDEQMEKATALNLPIDSATLRQLQLQKQTHSKMPYQTIPYEEEEEEEEEEKEIGGTQRLTQKRQQLFQRTESVGRSKTGPAAASRSSLFASKLLDLDVTSKVHFLMLYASCFKGCNI